MDKDVFEGLPVDIQIELLAGYKDELKSKKRRSFEQFPDVKMPTHYIDPFSLVTVFN